MNIYKKSKKVYTFFTLVYKGTEKRVGWSWKADKWFGEFK